MQTFELNLDGLVGPTHNYAGLGIGNVASVEHALQISNPQQAALQGLAKMRWLHEQGLRQAVMPPHARPNLAFLSALGITGTPEQQVTRIAKLDPLLLRATFSASAMWTANAATVSASSDTEDGRVHFTPANLISSVHRFHEADFSARLLRYIFADNQYFCHHDPLPATAYFSDEGAANHGRLCQSHSDSATNFFVYGRHGSNINEQHNFPARQTLEASQAIARLHQLDPDKTLFVQQNPVAIARGVFHNDVISVANNNLFLVHEEAFCQQQEFYTKLQQTVDCTLQIVTVGTNQLTLDEARASYLFNSQVLTMPNNEMLLLAPGECSESIAIQQIINDWISDPLIPITAVKYFDLRQSMNNGGGPACLRLRILLTSTELNAMHQGILISSPLLNQLETWICRHYRTRLTPADLADPDLITETYTALDELTRILDLGNIYPFQT